MKNVLMSICFLLFSITSFATHIIGGNFHVCQTGPNTFELTLRVYRDCNPGNSTSVAASGLEARDNVTNALVSIGSSTLTLLSQNVIQLGDSCWTPTGICVEEYIFTKTVTLSDNPNGYYFSWDICCRNGLITNADVGGTANPTAGSVFYAQIPDPALWATGGNCSPDFGSYPTDGYFCITNDINAPHIIDLQVTDADNDSLVYYLINPYDDGTLSKPFNLVGWQAGHSATNLLGNTTLPNMTIDPVTGIITAYPENIGVYVFAVLVEEWRNGVKIGEIVRDVQYQSTACNFVFPPVIDMVDSINVYVDDSICFDINVYEANGNNDSIFLQVTSSDFDLQGNFVDPIQNATSSIYTNWMNSGNSLTFPNLDSLNNSILGIGLIPLRYCWTPECEDLDSVFNLHLLATVYGCYGIDTAEDYLVINVIHIPPPTLLNVPDTVVISLGDTMCIDLLAMDSININDTLFLQPYSGNFDFISTFVPPSENGAGDFYYQDFITSGNTLTMSNYTYSGFTPGAVGQVGLRFCWTTDCDYIFQKEFDLNYRAFSTACGSDTIFENSHIEVDPPVGFVEPLPNVFTPNGDGNNDHFKLKGVNDPCYDFMAITIYNRWGQKVFESIDSNFEWDGTNNGKGECKAGTYYVLIDGSFGSTYDQVTGERVPNLVKDEYYIQLMR